MAGSTAAARVTATPVTTAISIDRDRRRRRLEGHRADRAQPGGHEVRQDEPEDEAEERPEDPEDERLDEDEALHLAAGRAGGPEQADLAHPLEDRHRERVDDEERAREERDGGDERGGRLEVGRRGAQRRRRGPAARRSRTARPADATPGRVTTSAGIGAGGEADVDPGEPGLVEDGLGGPQRDDHGPAARHPERAAAGQDADDAVLGRLAGTQHGQRGPDREAVLCREALVDEGARLVDAGQRAAGAEGQVVEPRLGDRVDPEDRDRRRQCPVRGGPAPR